MNGRVRAGSRTGCTSVSMHPLLHSRSVICVSCEPLFINYNLLNGAFFAGVNCAMWDVEFYTW
jgi:hypothetical protein